LSLISAIFTTNTCKKENGWMNEAMEQGISLNEGSITGVVNVEDFEGPLQGKSFVHLLQEIIQANVYVNVHTKSQKRGEIRGRVRKVKK
ncbi:CHRD domain-containing protein, partial [Bacillus sp. HC-Mk]